MAINGSQNGDSGYIVPLQINGKDVKGEKTYDVHNPGTGELLWKGAAATKKEAIAAVEAAEAAFPSWSKTKPSLRRDIFIKASDILASRADELSEYMDVETGSLHSTSRERNLPSAVEQLRDVAGRIVTATGSIPICGQDGRTALIYKEPYGVVYGIVPWNAPYILGFRAITYALAAGNTCVLKGSELCPRTFWAIGSVLKEAGLPDGCLNVIGHHPQDGPEVTTAIIEHPAVKKINYTGSTAVGSIIAQTAAKHLKPIILELGGKAPAIVLKDADLENAAQQCAIGAFNHSGQICMSTERIIVHSSIATSFGTAFKKSIEQIYPSDGPAQVLIASAGVQKNKKLVSEALSKGAKLLAGDIDAKETSEHRMRPIVVEGVTKDMDLYYQESFGPTVSLITVDSEEEAIALANDTEYGLSASVFTRDLAAGLRVAKQIESGAVHINNMTVHDEPNLPHGGVKKSGYGRFNASYGLEEFLKTKTVTWSD